MKNLLLELKRRHVFQVAITYVAGAWAILQVADLFVPMLGLPDWSMVLILQIAALGFPVAMVLAWMFDVKGGDIVLTEEDTAEVRESPSYLTWLQFILIFVLILTVGYLYYERLFSQPVNTGAPSGPEKILAPSVAVLPFENMSGDEENRYFSDGVSEELLNSLAQVEGLAVAARTSSFSFRNQVKDVIAIGRELGVATLLEGSVRKSGDRVRVTAQLIDTKNGYHLWSKTYDASLDDIFKLQNDISTQVVNAIVPMITGETHRPRGPSTSSVTAYTDYLKGRAILREPATDYSLLQARHAFVRATEEDPDYAEAWAGLCESLLQDFQHNNRSNFDIFHASEQACGNALTRSPSNDFSLDVHIALGVLYREAGKWQKSLDSLTQARNLQSDSTRALRELAITYSAAAAGEAGKTDGYLEQFEDYKSRAEDSLNEAIQLDPDSWGAHQALANFLFDMGDFSGAAALYDKVLTLHPGASDALVNKASALVHLGEESQAESLWMIAIEQALATENTGPLGFVYLELGGLHYYRGDFKAALQMYQEAAKYRASDHVILGRIAETLRALGRRDEERAEYKKAIVLAENALSYNPRNWETLGLLGIYHGFSGHEEKARAYARKLESLNNLLPAAHYLATLIYWSVGDSEEAYRHLSAAASSKKETRPLLNDPDLKQLRQLDETRFTQIILDAR